MVQRKTFCALGATLLLSSALLAAVAQSTTPAQAPKPPAAGQDVPRPATHGFQGGGRVYPASDPAEVEAGKKLFLANCAFCHGSSAKGGESGPNLVRSVLVLDDDHGDKIGPVILGARVDKGMPKFNFNHQQIEDISAFLLEQVKAAALRGTYQILNIVDGDPKAGEAYFNSHCSSCHSVTGDLAHIGSKYDAVTLQQKIVMPQERRRPTQAPSRDNKPITVTVTPASGAPLEGRLDQMDDFTVSLTTPDGEYRSFSRNGDEPKVVVHNPAQGHMDLLPKYTDADIHNLTAYLVTLK